MNETEREGEKEEGEKERGIERRIEGMRKDNP